MVLIRQLTKTSDLQKGNQLLIGDASAAYNYQFPRKTAIWQLIQYLSTGVFQYLSIRDWFKVPGVPFASLPDPVGMLGARAFCTDADRDPDALLTVGNDSVYYGYGTHFFGVFGSITNDVFTPLGGTIVDLAWDGSVLTLALSGDYPDSGWNTIVVNGNIFARADASFSTPTGYTTWNWVTTSPFSTVGDVDEIYFGTTSVQFNDPIVGGGAINTPVFSDGSIWRAG